MARVISSRRLIAPFLASTALALFSALPGAQAATASDNPVVAQINGKSYHRSDLTPILQRLQQQNQQLQGMTVDDPNIYPQLVQQLVTGVLVVDAAEKAKLDRDATFKKRMSELRATMLENYYAETVITHAATPEAEKALYDKKVAKNDVPLEVHARHILLGTEAEAKAVIDQLDKGGDFAKLAHDKSLDTRDPWRRVMQGHAVANVMPVVASNRIGFEPGPGGGQTFYGSSFIADHRGDLQAGFERGDEGVLTATFDLDFLNTHRAAWGFFRDRRTDLYGDLIRRH